MDIESKETLDQVVEQATTALRGIVEEVVGMLTQEVNKLDGATVSMKPIVITISIPTLTLRLANG